VPWGITLLSSISSVQLRLSPDICFPSDTWPCAFTPPLHYYYSILFLIVDLRAIGVIPIESRASGQVPFRRESPDVGNPLFRLKLFGQLKLLKMDVESFHQPHDCFGCFPRLPRMRPIDDHSDPANAGGMRTAPTAKDFGAPNHCSLSTPVGCQLVRYSLQGTEWYATHQKLLYMTRALFPGFLALSD
jgi:hypothetical protein